MKRAAQLTQAYKIEGVPAIAVNGKYVVITDNMKSFEQIVQVADYLLDQTRQKGGGATQKK